MEFPNTYSMVLMVTSHCTNDAEGTEVGRPSGWVGARVKEKKIDKEGSQAFDPRGRARQIYSRVLAQHTSFFTVDMGCLCEL